MRSANQKLAMFRWSACRAFAIAVAMLALGAVQNAAALPAFARQTDQNCVSCHAGGQFPELTPYGRLFKLTGYTIGERAVPFSLMGVWSYAKVADTSKSDSPATDFQKHATPIFATGSLFVAGKITDNIGVFSQTTYDNYASQSTNTDGLPSGDFKGHSQADNMDLRIADRFIDANGDLIIGASLNNNPSVSDVWNSAAAWMQYVPVPSPSSHQFIDGTTPFPGFGSGGNIAGLNLYAYWNQAVYAEIGTYRTANRAFSLFSAGIADADKTKLRGSGNPYWRFTLTHEWGPHNVMVGTSGMVAHIYDAGSDTSDPDNLGKIRNSGIDGQYQYLLDPHTITVQVAYMRQKQDYSANTMAAAAPPYFLADGVTEVPAPRSSDTTNVLRAKISYIYHAKYGGSLGLFNRTGTSNTLNQTSGYDSNGQITSGDPLDTGITSTRVNGNLTGNPATRGWTTEAFWIPLQYIRVGAQFTAYSKFNGATGNYDGFGRNAKDNNSLFLYLWAAY